jgi:sugar/nucleoside kinase (ribokinase family)
LLSDILDGSLEHGSACGDKKRKKPLYFPSLVFEKAGGQQKRADIFSMDVICVGNLVADIFASPIDSIPLAGQLKLTERLLLGVGGCAANTAACLRRLGKEVTVFGKVGKDLFGDFVLKDLERLGIEASGIKRSQTFPTSATLIINVEGEDRRYLHTIGANADFTLADVERSALEGARALYVGGYLAMPRFQTIDLVQLFRAAKARSLRTILDVVVPAGSLVSLEQVGPVLTYTDAFLPNDDEAARLTGQSDPARQAESLAIFNQECAIIITQGKQGALARRNTEVIQADRFKVKSVDDSGAGDAFAAGLIYGLLEEWSLEKILGFASAIGASSTRALGCIDGVFHVDEANAFVAENPLRMRRVDA